MKKTLLATLLVLVLTLTACALPLPPNASTPAPTGTATTAPTDVATETPSPTATLPAPTATVPPANTAVPATTNWPADLFISPVTQTSTFNVESGWLIAEPGVLLDDTTAWTIGQVDAPYFVNVPEGAFTYFSLGEGDIAIDGVTLHLVGEKGLNYLVLVRGKIDDGIVDNDLNLTAEVTEFVPGHAIWSHMPTGAYVSKDWFRDQLVASTTGGFTNCGATGCSRIIIVLWDTTTNFIQKFEVKAGTIDTWTLIP